MYHDFKYRIANISLKKPLEFDTYIVEPIECDEPTGDKRILVDIYDESMMSQRKAVFYHYYKHPEPVKDVKFYKKTDSEEIYFAFGDEKTLIIQKSHN